MAPAAQTTLTQPVAPPQTLGQRPQARRPTLVPRRSQRNSCHNTASGSMGAMPEHRGAREGGEEDRQERRTIRVCHEGRVTASQTAYSDHA